MNPALLAVFAHPDDESFGTGGTLAKYATNGTRVVLACATRGEVARSASRGTAAGGMGWLEPEASRASAGRPPSRPWPTAWA
jgi:LmbE family N-acetylglucosaminyl deacetylase